jgi:signal transduction histidine kinase
MRLLSSIHWMKEAILTFSKGAAWATSIPSGLLDTRCRMYLRISSLIHRIRYAVYFIGTGEIAGLAFEIRHLPIISRNRIIGVIGVATDITERKRAEAAEHEQHMMAEALRDTAAALTSTLKLDEVLDRILTNLGRVVPHDTANIMLLEDGIASVARSQGYSGRGLDVWINMLRLPLAKSPELARMVAANQTLALSWEGWLDAPEMAWVQSCASAPICLDGRVIGLLNLDSSTPNFFTHEEIERLRVFAAQAALAIRNAQIYEAERHERLLAQTLQKTAEALATSINLEGTLNQIVEQLGLVVRYDRVAIMLVEGDYLHVAGARGFPDIDTMQQNLYHYSDIPQLQQAMTAGVPVVLNDIETNSEWMQLPGFQLETRSWIGMPLIAREVVIGFLSAASNQSNAYTRRDAEAVAAFAQQAALAVENARILHEFETSLEHLREAQFQLVRAARLSAAGEIAAGVAHQINNPLTTIFVESHLMLQDLAPEDPMVESAEAIQDAARRAGAAVRRMLDLTRSHAYQMTDLDINHSLQSSLSLIRAQLAPHITRLTVELAPGLPSIEASAEHLEDVWINLLLNARDAVKDQKDGMIRVTSRLHEAGNAIVVTIGDNGPGIPADFVGRVFEPFFTTKADGTGLGLSICHDVVTRHGGAIQVDSGPDRGTMFTIILPIVSD